MSKFSSTLLNAKNNPEKMAPANKSLGSLNKSLNKSRGTSVPKAD